MTVKEIRLCDNLDCWNITYIYPWQKKLKHHFCSKLCRNVWQSSLMSSNKNPMKRPEVAAKFIGENNCMHRPEVAAKVSQTMKEKGENHPMKKPEISAKVTGKNNGMYGRTGDKSPSFGKKKSAETKHLLSISRKGKYIGENAPMFGKKHTPEARQKMSENHADFKGKNHPRFGRPGNIGKRNGMYGKSSPNGAGIGKGAYFTKEDGNNVWLRSTYETRIAVILTKFNIKWEYEPKRFVIKTATYCPDFYLPEYDIWWEVKGYMRKEALNKIKQFFILYPAENLRILYNEDITKLEQLISITKLNILTIGTGVI